MKIRDAFDGGCFLNLRKPKGLTSHDCVEKVRQIIGNHRVGHCGTLDPFAEGVLPVAIGRATRFIQYLKNEKEYTGCIRFGVTTTTDDIDGDILRERAVPWLSQKSITKALKNFVGDIEQIPPRVSAIKIDGRRSYDLARRNMDVPLKARKVTIHGIQMLKFSPGEFPEATINVKCGGGTYIRSIARECGEILLHPYAVDRAGFQNEGGQAVGGILASLLRQRSSTFDLESTTTLEALKAEWELNSHNVSAIFSVEKAMEHLHKVELPSELSAMYLRNHTVKFPIRLIQNGADTIHKPGYAVRIYSSSNPALLLGVSPIEIPSPESVCLKKRLLLQNP